MITPCIDILRKLATQLHNDLGSRQGTKHAPADLSKDIKELMRSLREHSVYVVEDGRTIESEKGSVPNTISQGLRNLTEPLKAYNHLFQRLQRRCRTQPLIGKPYYSSAAPEQGNQDTLSDTANMTELDGRSDSEDELEGGDEDDREHVGVGSSEAVFSFDTPEDLEIDLEFDDTMY